ncbi:putative uncharacterized protein [Pseudarthrobacter siccitolerans]|uniref:DUF4439 domain-containing protein n=1 Tax=Pseudarthrobacter siccitolerans TaxID=861266 RepID=A0A024H458_9MICC|nr:DUF4439 domain-containing protein [Pseudarthrobacter siccitolerans]CCQ46803.1 putative uncharacterized protein [Pseudarthrobacter siccitolerans]
MKDDNQENRPRTRYFRYAVFSLTALLVLSLGFALIPAEPPAPAEPPFSEQARAAALEQTLELRSAGMDLAASGAGGTAGSPPDGGVDQVVTLLTIQARALLLPGNAASAEAATLPSAASPAAAGSPTAASPSPSAPPVVTVAEFAAKLAASGRQRLKDAETADGGMARLLAGAGTAQLLAAERLGAAGAPETEPQGTEAHGTERQASASAPPACPATPSPGTPASIAPLAAAGLGAALVAAAGAELETVYGYQAALTRLPPEAAGPASEFLAQHQDLADQAEDYGRMLCVTLPPQPPGYVLDQEFLDAPAAGLAGLEADTLPSYGDVVALAEGATRDWALSALQEAARRAQHWGGGPDPLPGLVLDEGQLPQLPQ